MVRVCDSNIIFPCVCRPSIYPSKSLCGIQGRYSTTAHKCHWGVKHSRRFCWQPAGTSNEHHVSGIFLYKVLNTKLGGSILHFEKKKKKLEILQIVHDHVQKSKQEVTQVTSHLKRWQKIWSSEKLYKVYQVSLKTRTGSDQWPSPALLYRTVALVAWSNAPYLS